MNTGFPIDIVLLIIGILLATSIGGFVSGYLPYPFGIIVLSILLVARVLYLRGKS